MSTPVKFIDGFEMEDTPLDFDATDWHPVSFANRLANGLLLAVTLALVIVPFI